MEQVPDARLPAEPPALPDDALVVGALPLEPPAFPKKHVMLSWQMHQQKKENHPSGCAKCCVRSHDTNKHLLGRQRFDLKQIVYKP